MLRLLALPLIMSTLAQPAGAQPTAAVTPPPELADGRHDFDFLHGTWHVRNRSLENPLTGSTEWREFDGRTVERPILGGQGNLEEYDATLPDGTEIHAVALRLYEPATKRWTIRWSNANTGTLDPAMTGAFTNGRGVFYSHEDYKGRMILVRFHWTHSGKDAARWEQAFSADGGATWETNWIMEFTRTGDAPPAASQSCCNVVELRQYLLHPGKRETLIALFDREFVETQEAEGMTLLGQFRDIDRPDVFTWLRGFPDMPARAKSLGAFYGGPVWAKHRDAANATMISSDNVRLLRPARPSTGWLLRERPAPGAMPSGLVVATIYTLKPEAASGFADFFERTVIPRLAAASLRPFAMFETEPSENTFPRLPVREGERCFVWLASFSDVAEYERKVAAVAKDPVWKRDVVPALEAKFATPAEVMRLVPTARSRAIP